MENELTEEATNETATIEAGKTRTIGTELVKPTGELGKNGRPLPPVEHRFKPGNNANPVVSLKRNTFVMPL